MSDVPFTTPPHVTADLVTTPPKSPAPSDNPRYTATTPVVDKTNIDPPIDLKIYRPQSENKFDHKKSSDSDLLELERVFLDKHFEVF